MVNCEVNPTLNHTIQLPRCKILNTILKKGKRSLYTLPFTIYHSPLDQCETGQLINPRSLVHLAEVLHQFKRIIRAATKAVKMAQPR